MLLGDGTIHEGKYTKDGYRVFARQRVYTSDEIVLWGPMPEVEYI